MMTPNDGTLIIQHSSGPIRWMPSGSPHRAIVGDHVVVAHGNGFTHLDGNRSSDFLDISLEHTEFDDPVIAALSQEFRALRPLTDGGLWEGLLTSITGQAVSLHSAAVFQRRLCAMLGPEICWQGRKFHALPAPDLVADCTVETIRSIGLTTRRAQWLIDVAREVVVGNVAAPDGTDVDQWMRGLTRLPMVGPWTAASALLWGLGHPDVYPKGDVALLRAARRAYQDSTLTMPELDRLSDGWRPQRGIAARLLWTNLLGMGWDNQ